MKEVQSEHYLFGRDYFGPFLYGFSRWLYQEITTNHYRKIFFFSRDGYMIEKAFNLLNKSGIETEYVYFSRKSLSQALLWSCDNLEETLQYLSWKRYYKAAEILYFLGFNEEEREEIRRERQLNPDREISRNHLASDQEILNIYAQYRKRISDRSREQDHLLYTYLNQIGMTGECAIADIGWHGSMQFYLEQFIRLHQMDTVLNGYYIGIHSLFPLKSAVFGYYFTGNEIKKRKQILCFLGGYEKLFQGFEGSTGGYSPTDEGTMKPVLLPYEYADNQEIIHAIREWQRGAIDYVSFAAENHLDADDRTMTKPLIRFGKRPSLKETRLLSFLYNYDGTKVYFTAQKCLFKYTPREFIHALSNSLWKTGFMKSAFKIPFPYYTIYRLIRK